MTSIDGVNCESDNIETPLVSIVTPVFNSSKYLSEMIDSVMSQTYLNWELLIVDDCSTDSSPEILQKYAAEDKRISVTKLDVNSGSGIARNVAIQMSKGLYIAFLDSDDLWLPKKLEFQVNFMEANKLAFTYTSYNFISSNGLTIDKVRTVGARPIDYKMLTRRNPIGCLTVMLNADLIGRRDMPSMRVKQDYALWLNILRDGFKAYPIDKTLSTYRITEGSVTRQKYKLVISHYLLLRKHQKLSVLASMSGVVCWAFEGVFRSVTL